jgi:membrane protease YdiL (CAAX protease family)
MLEFFQFRKIGIFTPIHQILSITILALTTAALLYFEMRTPATRLLPATAVALMFAPLKEEIIFRGFILRYFEINHSREFAIWASAILFGLWHVQNIFALDPSFVLVQVLYTTVVGGQVTARIAVHFRTIWPGVVLHYATNLIGLTSLREIFLSIVK